MTKSNRPVAVALLALASAAEAFGATLREVVKREMVDAPEPPPCEPPVIEVQPTPPAVDAQGFMQMTLDDEAAKKILAMPVEVGRIEPYSEPSRALAPAPHISATTPAPGTGAPILEFNDTVAGDLWLIDEVGNITRNGAMVYVASPGYEAQTFTRIGNRLWFRAKPNRWFVYDGTKPVYQPDPPGATQ